MNCARFDAQAAAYLYGLLSEADHAAASEHVESCPSCAAKLAPLKVVLCREVLEVLADYVEGIMPEIEKRSLELHLRLCPDCVAYIKSYEATIAMTRSAFGEPGAEAEALPEDLVRAVLAARARQAR